MSLERVAQILDRILTLKDYSPFILVCDSLAQSADLFIEELRLRKDSKRDFTLLADLNSDEDVASKIQKHIQPGISVVGIYHTDRYLLPVNDHNSYAPRGLSLLEFMATTIVKIDPCEEAQQRLIDQPVAGIFDFSESLYNQPVFRVQVEHRRKTGRALAGRFEINSQSHTTRYLAPATREEKQTWDELTTFKLTLSDKQRKEREGVELPFMGAQQSPDAGGAIVYQYEKDDDYDEEDPYEDPF